MRQNAAPYSFWENAGRHLDLSERPQLSRRLPRQFQAGRGAQGSGVPGIHRGAGEEEGQGRDEAHPRGAELEFQHLSERLADEPIPAVARGASDRGQPHRGANLQFPPQGRAGADVPQHHRVRQHRQRHRLAGADRRSGNLQPHRPRPVQRRHRMAAGRPRLSLRRAGRARRTARRQFDQRGLHPQHARRLARLHEPEPPATRRAPQADMAKRQKPKTRIAAPQRRRVAAPRSRLPAKPADTLDLAPLRAIPAARGAPARRGEVRRLARAVHRRRLVLGAERAEPGQSARHGVADVRRPAAAGDADPPARQPAHVFAGAALALQPASSATSRWRTSRAAPPRCARNS